MDDAEEAAPARLRKVAVKRKLGAALKSSPALLTKIENYGAALCTPEEIAAVLGNELKQLQKLLETRNGRLAYHKGRARALVALRKAQLAMAKKSVPMAMQLGKVYLGQAELREQDEGTPKAQSGAAERLKSKILGIVDREEAD